jgi:EF-hand domain-containing protein 1
MPYVIHYYLADDTVEIREVHHANDGRDSFALLLRRQKLPKSFAVNQPGQNFIGDNYLTCDEIEPGGVINAFGRIFRIYGVDEFTQGYFKAKFQKHFEIGQIEYPKPRDPKPL